MAQAHHHLGATAVPVGAENVRAPLLQRRAAGGTDGGLENLFLRRIVVGLRPAQNFRNHLVGAANPHLGPHLHPLAQDVSVIVQGSPLDSRARQFHRRDEGQGGQFSRAAHLPFHLFHGGQLFLGLEFVSHGPAGEFVGVAQHFPGGEVGDLDHRAVDHVVQLRLFLFNPVHRRVNGGKIPRGNFASGHREPVLPQKIQHLPLIFEGVALDIAHVVEARVQPAGGGDRGVQVAQRPSGGVPRIFQNFSSGGVEPVQGGNFHKAFPVNLKPAGIIHRQGNGANGHHLGQYHFAGHAVAPGGGGDQIAVFVSQVDGQPVEFVLHHVGKGRQRLPAGHGLGPHLFRPAHPVRQGLLGLGLVHAPKSGQMGVRFKLRQRLRAYPAGGGIRQHHAGFRLQRLELFIQRVPLPVGHGWLRKGVILIGSLVDFRNQAAHFVHGANPPGIIFSFSIWARRSPRRCVPCRNRT